MTYYDYIHRTCDQGRFDASARDFKRRELKIELKHEEKPSKSFDDYLKESLDE